ncbi:putative beta-lysine N-acetyltransferase [uncultured Sunxiuqinia sp.]|uniref:putative beta-lysine N-acetyltransferase n=1 Tax=Sunxiuqinia rutila TaxID=1397841 RepID=UPI00262B7229|nr:putative beta-lysine N-acetyltransferase [uncultured Sunxiuqinia sp.]
MNAITEEKTKMDIIEKIGHSVVHHGTFNNRIFLLKYHPNDRTTITKRLNELAQAKGYTKIIAKVPAAAQPVFLQDGFTQEAFIPAFYQGKEDVFFMSKFLSEDRQTSPNKALSTLVDLLSEAPSQNGDSPADRFKLDQLSPDEAPEMAKIFEQVFATYPFPVTNPDYIRQTMQDGSVLYFGVWDQNKLVGISSAEVDPANRNAEMTDFAVLPDYRGHKLAYFLLSMMEENLKKREYKTLYTIARLNSPGMNKTFINHGYHFSGVLKNNTNISGQIESMNVYYKTIEP